MQTYTRSSEHSSGPALPVGTGGSHRVDSSPGGSHRPVAQVGSASGGRLRHQAEQSPPKVLLAGAGRLGGSGRRHGTKLAGLQSVHVPTNTNVASSVTQTQPATRTSDTDRPVELRLSLVSAATSTAGSTRRRKVTSTITQRPPNTTTSRRPAPAVSNDQSDRMLSARVALRLKEFTARATDLALANVTKSSRTVYDTRWNVFMDWCAAQEPPIVPEAITAPELANFFVHLKDTRGLQANTIAGYRSAINSVLKLYDNTAGQDTVVSQILQGLRLTQPSVKQQPPKWDLSLVLRVLARKPFEPIESCEMKWLTYKTAFLVLLGSGCRRSELHALDDSLLEHAVDWSWVDLQTLPEFWAKHQATDPDPSQGRVYHLKALDSTVDRRELRVCPVRSLREYRKRTKSLRGSTKRLFLPLTTTKANLHANTVSGWIKTLVQYSYEHATDEDFRILGIEKAPPNLHRPAHEVRAWSASVAWLAGTTSIRSLMRGCHWKAHNVFTDHYLRDVSVKTISGLQIAARFLPGST